MRTDDTDLAPHLEKSKHGQLKARLESHGTALSSVCRDPHKPPPVCMKPDPAWPTHTIKSVNRHLSVVCPHKDNATSAPVETAT